MSYLLDALQKSDRERKQGKVPDLNAQHEAFIAEPKVRVLWPWLLAATMLICTGLLSFVFWPKASPDFTADYSGGSAFQGAGANSGSHHKPLSPSNVASIDGRAGATQAEARSADSLIVQRRQSVSQPVPVKPAVAALSTPSAVMPDVGAMVDAVAEADDKRRARESGQPVALSKPSDGSIQRVASLQETATTDSIIKQYPDVNELTTDVRSRLPALEFTTHIYSTDHIKSFVMVNGAILTEGEFITGDLRLLRILPKHVVLKLDEHIFHLPSLKVWKQ